MRPAHKDGVQKMASSFSRRSCCFSFFPCFAQPSGSVEATAAWQWRNFWAARAPAGRAVVHINMDETCVRLDPVRNVRGAVALTSRETRRAAASLLRHAGLGVRRSAFTLVAFVADNAEVQAVLPQIIVASKRVLPQRLAAQHIRRADNVFVIAAKSAWLSAAMLCRIVRLVGVAVRELQAKYWLLLSMDVCPVHLSAEVALAARRAGLCLHYIPASMTSCLQPLDTHVFSHFKLRLSQAHHELMLQSPDGAVHREDFLAALCSLTRRIFSAPWPTAFRHCGFSAGQHGLGSSVMRALSFTEVPHVPATLPSLAQLQSVWKRGCDIPIAELFAHAVPHAPSRSTADATGQRHKAPSASPPRPLRMRLRSASHVSRFSPSSLPAASSPAAPDAATRPVLVPACPQVEVAAVPLRRLPLGRRLPTLAPARAAVPPAQVPDA